MDPTKTQDALLALSAETLAQLRQTTERAARHHRAMQARLDAEVSP